MVPERFERFITPVVRQRITALTGVADEPWMQDWPLEVANPDRLDELIELLQGAHDDDDRFALMTLVLYSLEMATPTKQEAVWPTLRAMLEATPTLFAHEIIYWSSGEKLDDGTWKLDDEYALPIAHLMRPVLARVAGTRCSLRMR